MNEYEYISFFEENKKELIKKVKDYKKRLIVNDIFKEINDFKNNQNRIFVYYGLRGIGKSTALYQTLITYPDSLFIDGSSLKNSKIDLLKLVKEYKTLKNNNILLIDEITDIENWGDYLKTFQDILGLKVIATGSSAIKISKQKNAILRRARFKEIPPLFFKEFLYLKYNIDIEFNKEIIDILFSDSFDSFQKSKVLLLQIKQKDPNIFIHFKEYLNNGFLQTFNNLTIKEVSDQIIDKIISNDFPEISGFNLTSLKKAKYIISSLSLYKPGDFSYQTISNNYSLSKNTVVEIINSFITSSLLIEINNSSSFANKFRKKTKLLFSSPSIRYGLIKNYPSVKYDLGFLREDSFVSSMYYNNIDITYLTKNIKSADYVITKNNISKIIEIGGDYKTTKQLDKGILLKDSDYIDLKGEVVILPLYLVNLI